MNHSWLVVANGHKALIFNHASPHESLQLVKNIEFEEGRGHGSDFTEDRPGRTYDSNSDSEGRHAYSQGNNEIKEQLLSQFSKVISKYLEASRSDDKFNSLIIAAEPKLLGALRKDLSEKTLSLVENTINRDLVNLPVPEIHGHIFN